MQRLIRFEIGRNCVGLILNVIQLGFFWLTVIELRDRKKRFLDQLNNCRELIKHFLPH
jgi:hypothetical protein